MRSTACRTVVQYHEEHAAAHKHHHAARVSHDLRYDTAPYDPPCPGRSGCLVWPALKLLAAIVMVTFLRHVFPCEGRPKLFLPVDIQRIQSQTALILHPSFFPEGRPKLFLPVDVQRIQRQSVLILHPSLERCKLCGHKLLYVRYNTETEIIHCE